MTQELWTGPYGDHRRFRVAVDDEEQLSVGGGGEGLVYRAERATDGASLEVALKMVTNVPLDDYGRIARRQSVLSNIEHPNLMHQLESFIGTALIDQEEVSDDEFDVIYIAAEWVDGSSLEGALADSGVFAGLHWVGQIAQAVAALHAYRGHGSTNGVVHRDIKPSNIRVNSEGDAVLIDFGIAKPHDNVEHTQGAGTYLWRAPEVIGGPGSPGPASDVWGIGALSYWVLIGEPPRLEGATAARERLTPAAKEAGFGDPIRLANHIASLLHTDPTDRPLDLERWVAELEVIVGNSGRGRRVAQVASLVNSKLRSPDRDEKVPTARGQGTGQKDWTHTRRARRRMALLGAAAVVLAGAITAVVVGDGGNTTSNHSVTYVFHLTTDPLQTLGAQTNWTLSGKAGDRLHAKVTLYNWTAGPLNTPYYEVLPATLRNVRDIKFNPKPTRYISDHVVEYDHPLGAGDIFTFRYNIYLSPTKSSWVQRLGYFVRQRKVAEARYFKSTHGVVFDTLASFTVDPPSLVLTVGETRSLSPFGTQSNGAPDPYAMNGISWNSTNPSVASVKAGATTNELVRGVAPGNTTLTAQAGPETLTIHVRVTDGTS
jgi:serine/threonine protein kinase